MAITIAKLRISLKDAGIQYNSATELETKVGRGSVLVDGKVVRGLGTHFASKEAQDRYNKLTARSNAIRDQFNSRFARFLFDGTYVVKPGEGKEFAAQFVGDQPDITVDVFEYDVTGDPDERELSVWSGRIKEQFKRAKLGRGEDVDEEGLKALETLAGCPILAAATRDRVLEMVGQVRAGKIDRVELKRGIGLLEVQVDNESLSVRRGTPQEA
jgi:hypothetical protein